MYRTNNFAWKLVHVLCILAHLGLAAAGAGAYVYNASKEIWMSLARRGAGPCHGASSQQVLLSSGLPGYASETALIDVAGLHTLSMSCLVVVCSSFLFRPSFSCQRLHERCKYSDEAEQGVLGLVTNIVLFLILLQAEKPKVTLTEGEQHWRKQIVTFFSCISNLLLAGAGVGLAGVLGMNLSGSKSLITLLVWAAIQV